MLSPKTNDLVAGFAAQFKTDRKAIEEACKQTFEFRGNRIGTTIHEYRYFANLLIQHSKRRMEFIWGKIQTIVPLTVKEPDENLASALKGLLEQHMRATIETFDAAIGEFRARHSLPPKQIEDCMEELHGIPRSLNAEVELFALDYEQKMNQNPKSASESIVILGDNARVNINSTDNSTNTVNSEAVFKELREVIENHVSDKAQRIELTRKVLDLEESRGNANFGSKMKEFVAFAADCATLWPYVQPVVEKLKRLVG